MEGDALLLQCCEALLLHSSSTSSPRWQQAAQQLQAAVKSLGPRRSSPLLLDFLRRPCLPDCVLDALSHSIALCCGSCSAPPSNLTFTFSPLLSVNIKEMDYVKGGLGWKVWGAALVLSRRLLSLQKSFQDKHVLELGSGCGLCGLLAVKLGACEVVLTDYEPEILINLCSNVLLLPASILEPNQLGQKSTPKMGLTEMACNHMYDNTCRPAIVKVRILDWAEDASSLLEEKEVNHLVWPKLSSDETFDWVIGSDLIYNHYNIKSLVSVVKRRLSKQGGQGVFAAPIRENQELSLFLYELGVHAMDAHVEQCSQQEWEACMEWLEVEEGGTLHGVDHYEGGLAIIYVTHRM
ncbi:hypothetical protein L7F22_035286 [Adiantum nelumboides]|nr:hypothetical protein [Adiantum nelumboides]